MRRSVTPFLSEESGVQKYDIEVDPSADRETARVFLTERSLFGSTSMNFSAATARQIAAYLLRAADVAEGDEDEKEHQAVPKLAAVR